MRNMSRIETVRAAMMQAMKDHDKELAPKMMSEDEVEAEVTAVLAELGLDAPTAKQKGLIMKTLMPRVKGKADGALVQNVLARHLA